MTTVVNFLYLQQVHPSLLDMVTKVIRPCSIRTGANSSVNDKSCDVFATPGLTSSSNGGSYLKLLFSECTSYSICFTKEVEPPSIILLGTLVRSLVDLQKKN